MAFDTLNLQAIVKQHEFLYMGNYAHTLSYDTINEPSKQ